MTNFYKKLALVCTTLALFTFVAISQTTVTYSITVAEDDYEEFVSGGTTAAGMMDVASSDLELGTETAGQIHASGMIWRGVAIPVGATITNAFIQFTCDETDAGGISLDIYGFKEANTSAPFLDVNFNLSSRPKTTATVTGWTPDAWAVAQEAGAAQKTPDLKTIIQEIVNLAGWASGNNLGLVVWNQDPVKQHKTAEAFEGEPTQTALLSVTYTAGVGVADVYGSSVSMYPNPTTGKVTIKNPSAGKFGYAIYNVIGKVVKQLKLICPVLQKELISLK
jgi:hypothetical protein